MPLYKIPVTYVMYGHYEIEAESIEQALDEVLGNESEACQPLPPDAEYVTDSLNVDSEDVIENNTLTNEEKDVVTEYLDEYIRQKTQY